MSDYRVDITAPLPRYYQVYVSLEERIRSGEFGPGGALPSERQLVLDYGVSRITIVKALDLLVRDNLVERQHGRGNFVLRHAESTMCKEGCQVAFCVPTPSEAYIFSTLMGATRVAMRHRIKLQIVAIDADEEEVKRVHEVVAGDVDGILLFSRSTHVNAALYQEMRARAYPFVMIDRYCPEVATDRVLFDDETAGYRLTEFLIKQGHRRIAALPGTEVYISTVRERLRGYRTALEKYGLPYDENLVCQDIYQALGITRQALQDSNSAKVRLIEHIRQYAPTAIFSINNYLAEEAHLELLGIRMALMQALIDTQTQGVNSALRIPIATVSHKRFAPPSAPCIAMAWQPGEILGERGMELLIERINQPNTVPPRTVTMPMEMISLAEAESPEKTG